MYLASLLLKSARYLSTGLGDLPISEEENVVSGAINSIS
jgi:hypothetical protein